MAIPANITNSVTSIGAITTTSTKVITSKLPPFDIALALTLDTPFVCDDVYLCAIKADADSGDDGSLYSVEMDDDSGDGGSLVPILLDGDSGDDDTICSVEVDGDICDDDSVDQQKMEQLFH